MLGLLLRRLDTTQHYLIHNIRNIGSEIPMIDAAGRQSQSSKVCGHLRCSGA